MTARERLEDRSRLAGWAAFLVATAIVGATWAELDRVSAAVAGAMGLLVLFCAWAPWPWLGLERLDRGTRRLPGETWLALACALPAAFFLVATWNQEFPFAGDHDFHLLAGRASLVFWRPWIWVVPLAAATLWVAARRNRLGLWSVGWLAVLGVASRFAQLPWELARVPAGAAFLNLPLVSAWSVVDAPSPLNAARLTTFASLPLWLLVLRPLVLGRKPDLGAALFGAFFWLQKDVVYYLTTSYAEPWMVVVVLLAVEHLLTVEGPQELRACPMVGAAAMIKEPAILALPFFWLACRPWRGSWRERTRALLVGVVSGAPFLLYYAVRREAQIWRGVGLASSSEVFSIARATEVLRRAWIQFDWPGLLVLGATLAATIWLAFRRRGSRFKLAMLGAAALGQVVFFYCESFSTYWTGYPRFQLLAQALLGVGLLVLPETLETVRRSRLVAAVAGVAALQAGVTLPFLRLALLPDPARNFVEHYEAPCFFPIGSLIGEAERVGALEGVQRIAVSDPIGTNSFEILETAYLAIERRRDLMVVPGSYGAPRCDCRDPGEAVLVPFVFFVHLAPVDPMGAAGRRSRNLCRERMAATCARVFERSFRGETTGLLGVGAGPKS